MRGTYALASGEVQEVLEGNGRRITATWFCSSNPWVWTDQPPSCTRTSFFSSTNNGGGFDIPSGWEQAPRPFSADVVNTIGRQTLNGQLGNAIRQMPGGSSAKPAPAPAPAPAKPDLSITRLSGPTKLAVGETAEYEVAIWNDGAPAKDFLVQIGRGAPLQLAEVDEASNQGFTCQANINGFGCTGSLGGEDGPMAARSAVFKVQAMGMVRGTASLVASANHSRTIEEETIDNNLELLEVTVE
jgi:hypothetical protein